MRSNAQSTLFEPAPKHDPGGKVRIAIPPSWNRSAIFSPCEQYRYELSRIWRPGPNPLLALFVMQNPSTADADFNDPTIAKDCRLAENWGYDGILIGNVCAWRATNNKNLPKDPAEALGPENHTHLLAMAARASLVVMAYGQLPKHLTVLGAATVNFLRLYGFKLHYLRLAKNMEPWHPLYLPDDIKPVLWEPAA